MKPGGPLRRKVRLVARVGLPRSPFKRAPRTVPKPRRRTAAGAFPQSVRDLMWARCGGLCESCGEALPAKGWTGQHRRARGIGGTTRPETATAANGLAVHELPCHRAMEGNPGMALRMGWRVHQADDPETAPVWLPDGRRVLLTMDGRYVDMPVLP